MLLRGEDISKSYGGTPVLRGLSFEVAAGEIVCLIGRSGSGKSTLLRCIKQLETIDEGRLYFEDTLLGARLGPDGRLHKLHESEALRQHLTIGMVFQRFNLFPHLTARENVELAPRIVRNERVDVARKRANELLTRVGLEDRADAYPRHLSGGQQQRVAIARALAMEPRVILFDEPTSALDPELVGEVLAVIKALTQSGTTMMIVTHEMGFVRDVADRILFLEAGQIVEEGPPSVILERPEQPETQRFLARLLAREPLSR